MQGRAKASKSRHKPSQTNIIALDCSCICMDLQVFDDIWHDPRRRRLFKSATKHLSGKKEKIPYCYIGQSTFARTSHDSYVFKSSPSSFLSLGQKVVGTMNTSFPKSLYCNKSINEYLPNMTTPLAKKKLDSRSCRVWWDRSDVF